MTIAHGKKMLTVIGTCIWK